MSGDNLSDVLCNYHQCECRYLFLRLYMSRFGTLLSVIPYPLFPTTSAGRKSILHFNNRVAGHINDVAMCAGELPDQSKIKFKCIGSLGTSKLRYINPFLIMRLRQKIRDTDADFVLFEHPYMAWMGWFIGRAKGVRWGIRSHNIEYERFKSFGKWWWKILRRYELSLYSRADAVFFITEDDEREAANLVTIKHSFVMPTGMLIGALPTDKEGCRWHLQQKHGIDSDTNILLYNGALDYLPNVRALDAILDEVNPRLMTRPDFKYKILVCGSGLETKYNELSAYADKNIIFCGFVDDITTYFKGADLYMNPVIGGGGIKTRAVEALSFNTNTVSTHNGSIGLNYRTVEDKVSIVADGDWEAFAVAVITMSQRKTRDTTPEFYQYYYWDNIVERFIQQVNSILS